MCVSLAARVVEVSADGRSATATVARRTVTVSLDLLVLEGRPVAPGDWILANAGLAVALIGEDQAGALSDLWEEGTA
jgi:hydrogenase maturation factor